MMISSSDRRFRGNNFNGRNYRISTSTVQQRMVRNIDLAEAIIFYGRDALFDKNKDDAGDDDCSFLPGVENLLQECVRDDTKVLAILDSSSSEQQQQQEEELSSLLSSSDATVHVRAETQPPPNPRDLWEAIHDIVVKPKGFGGSSGFGTKAADPERNPLPRHCVVFCHTEDQVRAARYAGMRALCLTDNDLADAVMFDGCWETVCIDDVATPGSFWLNPSHPRDDVMNAVDPETVMAEYENNNNSNVRGREELSSGGGGDVDDENEDLSDDQLAAILADMDSL